MRLYLVQHGEAKSKDADPERHLTEKGLRDVEKVAAFLKPLGLSAGAVWHSGKARARQTAETLAQAVTADATLRSSPLRSTRGGAVERPGLAPDDPVEPVKEELARAEADIMIVGHLPFLGKLASLLVAGSESAGVVAFRNAGVVCLERGEGGAWRTTWALIPEILP